MSSTALARPLSLSWWDRLLIGIAPDWGMRRVRARASATLLARHFEAAQGGRRTSGWQRFATDANTANGPALTALRELSRDLVRNNGWAENGVRTIVGNTVGWGIMPRPKGPRSAQAAEIWEAWSNSTACDFDGLLSFTGLQALAMRTIAESGEVLILRQPASSADGLPVPLRLQVLEPDYLDKGRNGATLEGGSIVDGIEFDRHRRRVAFWLFSSHPGGQRLATAGFESVRIPAERVLHIYRVDRPGQVRGVPWLASAIAKIKDLDDFEDAELMQQKVAACFGAFVSDLDGSATPLGGPETTGEDGYQIESLEPGHIAYLPPGKQVSFAQPPAVHDTAFSTRVLRRIAVSLGVTYEDLSGDYSQVNFSSARIARLSHWTKIHEWRWQMLIPRLCEPVWRWVIGMAAELEGWAKLPTAQWSAPPMPILEPDKEGLAYQRLIRIGAMTWSQMVRELGEDPALQLEEIETMNREFDKRGIVLDSDPRRMSGSGQAQVTAKPTEPAEAPAEGDITSDA